MGRGRRTCLALMAGAVKVQVVSGVCPCCVRVCVRECVWWMGINEKVEGSNGSTAFPAW